MPSATPDVKDVLLQLAREQVGVHITCGMVNLHTVQDVISSNMLGGADKQPQSSLLCSCLFVLSEELNLHQAHTPMLTG